MCKYGYGELAFLHIFHGVVRKRKLGTVFELWKRFVYYCLAILYLDTR